MATKATSGWLKIAAERQQQSQSSYRPNYNIPGGSTPEYRPNYNIPTYQSTQPVTMRYNDIMDAARRPVPRSSPITGQATRAGTITVNNKTYPVNATIENGEASIPKEQLDKIYAQAYKDMSPEGYERKSVGERGSIFTATKTATYPSTYSQERGVIDLSSYPKTFEGRTRALSALKKGAEEFEPRTTTEWIRKEKLLKGTIPLAVGQLGLRNLQRPEVRQEFKRAASSLMPSFSNIIPKQPEENLFLGAAKPVGKRTESYDVFFNNDINI